MTPPPADAAGEAKAPRRQDGPRDEEEGLKDAVQQALEEARMVLPGIQALFGFQLIAVFNQRFDTALDRPRQVVHLAALLLVALSAALVMTPAAYHRQACGGGVSRELLRVVSAFVSAALLPLMAGLCLDVYLVALLIVRDEAVAVGLAASLLALLAGLWFVFPHSRRRPDRGEAASSCLQGPRDP